MIENLKIRVVVDNSTSGNLLGEHGLSFYVEVDDKKMMFDVAQGLAFSHNIEKMNIDLNKINSLVLSHGHSDHTGNLDFFLNKAKSDLKIYMSSIAFEPKFVGSENNKKNIGMTKENINALKIRNKNIIYTDNYTVICNDVFVTGEVPKVNNIETGKTIPGSSKGEQLLDDQSMFFNTTKGIVVLLGCCHAGLSNTLNYVAELAKVDEIYTVIGGMHLKKASQAKLDLAVDVLKKYNVQLLAPCHCTGQKETAFMYSKLPNAFSECFAGKEFVL